MGKCPKQKIFVLLNDIIKTSFKFKEDNMRKVELSLKEKDELKNKIEALYTSKYFNCNYTQFTE